MTVDPRSLIYPGHDDREKPNGTNEELNPQPNQQGDRRTGTNDELKDLDRVERRKEKK